MKFLDTVSQIKNIWGVKVYTLVGKSGTGKSFRAQLIAEKHNIPYLIDDGLLIHNQQIVAGQSAKREALYIKAVKVALFDDDERRDEMIEAIKKQKIKKLLLLGTSDKMVNKVVKRLNLPKIYKTIKIEDVSSCEEIEKAQNFRSQGKHVIPVPVIEIKKDYSHIISDSIHVFFQSGLKGVFRKKERQVFEKSEINPTFQQSKQGSISMSETVLSQMILHCIDEFNPLIEVKKIRIKGHSPRYRVKIFIEAYFGENLGTNLSKMQSYIIDMLARYTGVNLEEVSIEVNKVVSSKVNGSSE